MINTLKLEKVIPFAFSTLCLALAGCGGESASVNEDPYAGVKTSTNGCDWSSPSCQPFVINYPIAGLNFDCKSDPKNHFETLREGNIFSGGCQVGDKVNFYIQGDSSARRVHLGEVDLSKLGPKRIGDQPIQISLLDIATAMTGQPATAMDNNDQTFRTTVALARLFQAISLENQVSNSATDVQAIELNKDKKNELSVLNQDVLASDFIDGSYLTDLAPWLNVSSLVDEASAKTVAEQHINLKNVSIYLANFFALEGGNVQLGGFNGASESSPSKKTIANLYALTDRQGYSMGYTVQWTGIPSKTGSQVISPNERINLLTQVAPIRSNVNSGSNESSVKTWIDPLTDQIKTPLTFRTGIGSDQLNIFQGKFINQKMIPGNAYYYKEALGVTTAPDESSNVYGRWSQTLNNESFKGNLDLNRVNPATFLENNVFKTVSNTRSGDKYIFPLYATLSFKFKEAGIAPIDVGIVIDEHGDIRTNRTASNLASNKCNTVQSNYIDNDNVQQFRIGTTGATNSTATDKSITVRMIFANQIFGNLDGAIVGFNSNFAALPSPDNSNLTVDVVTSGARINLRRLLDDGVAPDAINISDWRSDTTLVTWDNMYAVSQATFNAANPNVASNEQKELAKLQSGTIERIQLLDCSTYATK